MMSPSTAPTAIDPKMWIIKSVAAPHVELTAGGERDEADGDIVDELQVAHHALGHEVEDARTGDESAQEIAGEARQTHPADDRSGLERREEDEAERQRRA